MRLPGRQKPRGRTYSSSPAFFPRLLAAAVFSFDCGREHEALKRVLDMDGSTVAQGNAPARRDTHRLVIVSVVVVLLVGHLVEAVRVHEPPARHHVLVCRVVNRVRQNADTAGHDARGNASRGGLPRRGGKSASSSTLSLLIHVS